MDVAQKMTDIRRWETQLDQQKDGHQRLHLLTKLIEHYAFTDSKKAIELLRQQAKELKKNPDLDFQMSYHLNTAFIENQLYNYKLAELHFEEALNIIEDRGNVKEQAEMYIDYAGILLNRDKKELASTMLDKAHKLIEVFPNARLKARITCREGFLSLHYANYAKAIELLLEADKSINALPKPLSKKDIYFLTLIQSGMGRIYERNNDIQKSVKAYQKAVDLCESIGMRTRLSWHYLNVGNAYMALANSSKAEAYFRKAIRVSDDISRTTRASAYANLGYLTFKKQNYKEALNLYNTAIKLYGKEDSHNFSVIEHWKAQLFVALEKNTKAEKHFKKALKYAKDNNDYKQLAVICKDIATYYANQKDFEEAYRYQLRHDEMDEMYREIVNQRQLMELEVKYEAEKKKQETEMLRLQSTGLQLKALRAQMNPHFMYNALNSIQHFITSENANLAAKYLAKFAKLMRQSLDYSDLEIISLEKEIEFLEDYLYINQKLRFEDQLNYQIHMEEELEEDIMGIPTMIIQPYVENAIEHGLRKKKKGMVKLHFKLYDDNTILCIVLDNGIGRKKARELQLNDPAMLNHESKGTNITQKRLEILNKSKRKGVFVKTIDMVDSKKRAKGTRVEILIPIETIQKWQPN